MGSELKLQAPRRPRRSQAERTAETRARIKAAVVESITEVGYRRTTATEIARRAGVSWGAVQHHFGDKQGILVAVLEDSFNRFAGHLVEAPVEGASLEERVSIFVDRAWDHFGSPHYRSTFEILLDLSAEEDAPPWHEATLDAWNRVWDAFFGDAGLPRRATLALQLHTVACLSGLAATQILGGPGADLRRRELDLLKRTLARELSH